MLVELSEMERCLQTKVKIPYIGILSMSIKILKKFLLPPAEIRAVNTRIATRKNLPQGPHDY